MRIGNNPNKDKTGQIDYLHQIIIPVYIPNFDGYFKDGLKVFELQMKSLFKTIHDRTFITIVDNGSNEETKSYIDDLLNKGSIHEVIHTENIGKINSILKGLTGMNTELVTISDADVFFKNGWQEETTKIFNMIHKAGVVGLVPQFNTFKTFSGNILWDNLLKKRLKFIKVYNPEEINFFYKSIGWKDDFNKDYLRYILGLQWDKNLNVIVGSGHFVATYRRDVFREILIFNESKMGNGSEQYLDELPLKKDYWRVTTYDNFAFHMGNTLDDLNFYTVFLQTEYQGIKNQIQNIGNRKDVSKLLYLFKNKIIYKILKVRFIYLMFLKFKGLPKSVLSKY